MPRYSGKSSGEQYRQVFETNVCLNGWDGVTAVLQLFSHLDGDALNVALLVPETQRVLSGVLVRACRNITALQGDWQSTNVSLSIYRYSCSWCGIDSSPDERSAPSIDISIVWGLILLCGTL